jgi:hypothetical protein
MALEAPTGCAFYCWFLYLALRARERNSAGSVYGAVVIGALTFYSYAPLKFLVLTTALLLALSNLHWLRAQPAVAIRAIGLAVLLALPELRFQVEHPGANLDQLRVLHSYIVDRHLSVAEKLTRFAGRYARGLSPRYWYDPRETGDLSRHVMKGWGNMLPAALPFGVVGLVLVLSRLQRPSYRGLFLATLAAPVGAATVEIQLPRSLPVVIPLTIMTALGLEVLVSSFAGRAWKRTASAAVLAGLTIVNASMLVDAVRSGPTWYADYGLYGLQFGGRQVAGAVRADLAQDSHEQVVISSSWANGTDTLMTFFLPTTPRVRVENLQTTLVDAVDRYGGIRNTTFVVTPSDLAGIRRSRLFDEPRLRRVVPLPDGNVGFTFIRLRYSRDAAERLAAKQRKLRRPATEYLVVDGTPAHVTHTPFDLGRIADLFDGDNFTLARTAEANVMALRIAFASPRLTGAIRIVGRDMTLECHLRVYVAGRQQPLVFERAGSGAQSQPTLAFSLGSRPLRVSAVTVEVFDPTDNTTQHVHVREIEFR